MKEIERQLTLTGLTEALRHAETLGSTEGQRRQLRRIEQAHELLSALPSADELAFLHSGLAQTFLPHKRPADNRAVWRRSAGRFTLLVTPGVFDAGNSPRRGHRPAGDEGENLYVGVPYGTKARLILIYLQTEGMRSRVVSLGPTLSAFLRSLGLAVTGGSRGTIGAVREQCLRIARCQFTMQWSERGPDGSERTRVTDTRIAEGMELWQAATGDGWTATLELSAAFHEALREHAVPLDKRGIAHLSDNSLGLDLYALLAYRLPRLQRELHLRWDALQSQIGSEYARPRDLAEKVRAVMPSVLTAYPHAKVELAPTGLVLRPSPPAVPKTLVQGMRLLDEAAGATNSAR